MEDVQRQIETELKLSKQQSRSETIDMFGQDFYSPTPNQNIQANKLAAKDYLLKKLSKNGILIDYEKWADFLEDSDLYPSDFQAAMKELLKEGCVKNLNADASKRWSKPIKPNWPEKSERWILV
jgi:hypothetical protein